MGEIINLRHARKARKRAQDLAQAEANRMKHGRTKVERQVSDMDLQRHEAILEGARRERDDKATGREDQGGKTTPG